MSPFSSGVRGKSSLQKRTPPWTGYFRRSRRWRPGPPDSPPSSAGFAAVRTNSAHACPRSKQEWRVRKLRPRAIRARQRTVGVHGRRTLREEYVSRVLVWALCISAGVQSLMKKVMPKPTILLTRLGDEVRPSVPSELVKMASPERINSHNKAKSIGCTFA